MKPLDRFHQCLKDVRDLEARDLGNEASTVLQEAEHWLDKARDLTFRLFIRSMSLASQAKTSVFNPNNPLFVEEIAWDYYLKSYGQREEFLSLNLERSLDIARAIHTISSAERHLTRGESAEASTLLLSTMRRDSLSAPLIEELWRQSGGPHDGGNQGEPLFVRLAVAGVDKQPALNKGHAVVVVKDRLFVTKGAGGVEVFDLEGEHLASHRSDLVHPSGCSGPDGQAWFASGGTFARFDPEAGETARFSLKKGRDYPEGANFKNLTHGSGLLWHTYYQDPSGLYNGVILGVDPTTGSVAVRHELGECCPVAAADDASLAVLDALTCRVWLVGETSPPLFGFDSELMAAIPINILHHADLFFIADTTTLLVFSASGTLLGRLRPGQVSGRLTDITGIALSPGGETLFAMDLYSNCLFRITVEPVWTQMINREMP